MALVLVWDGNVRMGSGARGRWLEGMDWMGAMAEGPPWLSQTRPVQPGPCP